MCQNVFLFVNRVQKVDVSSDQAGGMRPVELDIIDVCQFLAGKRYARATDEEYFSVSQMLDDLYAEAEILLTLQNDDFRLCTQRVCVGRSNED